MLKRDFLLPLFFSCQSSECALAPVEEACVSADYWRQIFYKPEGTFGKYKVSKTILKPEGISEVSNLTLSCDQKDRFHILKAEVVQANGERIQLKRSQIVKRLEAASHIGVNQTKQISFLFPKLALGSTVEIVYEHDVKTDWEDQTGILESFGPAKERIDSLLIEYLSDEPWCWKAAHMDDFDIHVSQDKKSLKIKQKYPRYYWFLNENSKGYVRDRPLIALNTTEDVEKAFYGVMRAWNNILAAKLPLPLVKVIKSCENKPAEERVIDILRYIRDHYRYLGDWREEKRGRQPFSLSETVKHGYGDCKDLSAMLVAMLRASGIKANPAFLYRGLVAPKTLLPSVIWTNHAVVRAEVGEKVWWLDPTNVSFLPDHIPLDIQDREAVVFLPEEKILLTQTPKIKPEDHAKHYEITRIYDEKGYVTVNTQMICYGVMAQKWADRDYLEGVSATDRAITPKDIAGFKMTRDKTDFVVSKRYQVEQTSRIKITHNTSSASIRFLPSAIGFDLLEDLVKAYQHFMAHHSKNDLYLIDFPNEMTRVLLPNCQFIEPSNEYTVSSPWIDCSVSWYDAKELGGCVWETHFTRKVDWLDCETLNSVEFIEFLETVNLLQAKIAQTVVYSKSNLLRKLGKNIYKHSDLYVASIITCISTLAFFAR